MAPTYEQRKNRIDWINELLCGTREQGIAALCKIVSGTPKFCCLGVAADIANVPTDVQDVEGLPDRLLYLFSEYERSGITVPAEWFAERFGISVRAADSMIPMLAGLNDKDVSFATIGYFIEQLFHAIDSGAFAK